MKELLAKRAQQLGAAPPTAYGATEKKEENDDDDERFQGMFLYSCLQHLSIKAEFFVRSRERSWAVC